VSDIDTVVVDSLKVLDPKRPIREEKQEPVSDIDAALMDSLKVLDPKPPIREADSDRTSLEVRFVPTADTAADFVRSPFQRWPGALQVRNRVPWRPRVDGQFELGSFHSRGGARSASSR
jgi:hypothetical protein